MSIYTHPFLNAYRFYSDPKTVPLLPRRLHAIQRAEELGAGFLKKLPILVISLLCVILFWFFGSWAGGQKRLFERLGMNELSSGLLRRFLKLFIIGIGVFIALEILDATAIAAGVLGVAGVAGVALGFAFRNIVENYLAGILLSMRNPFSSGDAVKMGDHSGKVIRLTSRDTVLMTYDGNHLRIPNSVIINSALTNYSRNPLRRFDFLDGALGNVGDFLFDDKKWGLRYLVADAGGWFRDRKVLVSPARLSKPKPTAGNQTFPINMTREQLAESPLLDLDAPVSRQFEIEYQRYHKTPACRYGRS
jgi:hypothetical protein